MNNRTQLQINIFQHLYIVHHHPRGELMTTPKNSSLNDCRKYVTHCWIICHSAAHKPCSAPGMCCSGKYEKYNKYEDKAKIQIKTCAALDNTKIQ